MGVSLFLVSVGTKRPAWLAFSYGGQGGKESLHGLFSWSWDFASFGLCVCQVFYTPGVPEAVWNFVIFSLVRDGYSALDMGHADSDFGDLFG